ncbi:unnamed protein product, partial [Prorocentrum cordatum]
VLASLQSAAATTAFHDTVNFLSRRPTLVRARTVTTDFGGYSAAAPGGGRPILCLILITAALTNPETPIAAAATVLKLADSSTMNALFAALVAFIAVSATVIANGFDESANDVENPHGLIKMVNVTLGVLALAVTNLAQVRAAELVTRLPSWILYLMPSASSLLAMLKWYRFFLMLKSATLLMLTTLPSLQLLWQVVRPPIHCRRRARGEMHMLMMVLSAAFAKRLRWTSMLYVLPQLLLQPVLQPMRLLLNYNPSQASSARRPLQSRHGRIGAWIFKLAKFKNSVNGRIVLLLTELPHAPQALAPWLADAKLLAELVDLVGGVAARRFTLRVLGSKPEASTRATVLVRNLRTSAGWRTFQVSLTEGAMVAMRASTDKSPNMVRGEVQSKRMSKLLEETHPTLTWRCRRARCHVLVNSAPCCQLEPQGQDEPTRIRWNNNAIAQFNIDTATTEEAFNAAFSAAEVQWSG